MRKLIFTTILCSLSMFFGFAQQCNGLNQLVLRGAKGNGIYHQLAFASYSPNGADTSQYNIAAAAWTCNSMGIPICNFWSNVKFKLTQIPKNAIITSANLYLYAKVNSTLAYSGHPTYHPDGNNEVSIKRVTSFWDNAATNYGPLNQTTTDIDQVILPTSTSDTQNYVSDIKNLVQYWVQNPDSNFGMELKHIDETYYRSMIFHSGQAPAAQQPRLEICYFTEDNYPRVFGTAFYDANNNGVFDSTEVVAPYQKVALSNGNFTFTDANGYYELSAYPFGQYDVIATAPNFYTAPNLITSLNFSSIGQMIPNNIGFTSTGNADSLNIKIVPFHRFARPGFSFPCYLEYENLGNTVLNTVTAFDFDSSKINFDSCSNSNTISFGNFIGLNAPVSIKPGERHFYLAYFTTKTTAMIGDTVHQFANTYGGSALAFDTIHTPVSASYDPNDIQATESLTLNQVAKGEYIDYTIRFENIGNDTAINIYILDTLPNKLQISSLQVIGASHPCQLTVKDNVVKANFKNIFLLYKSLNELKCGGFVTFRIKPLSNLTVGTSISNKAAIYFDFNEPIITNTAVTKIVSNVLPLKMMNYELRVMNDNKVNNIWKTIGEENVNKYLITKSTDGKEFKTIGTVKANNGLNNEYNFIDEINTNFSLLSTIYYKIVAIDNDGKKIYSAIKSIIINQLSLTTNVFPNPAKDLLNISSNETIKEIRVINTLGQQVLKQNINSNNYQLPIIKYQLSKGLYILQIISVKGNVSNNKIIIE